MKSYLEKTASEKCGYVFDIAYYVLSTRKKFLNHFKGGKYGME